MDLVNDLLQIGDELITEFVKSQVLMSGINRVDQRKSLAENFQHYEDQGEISESPFVASFHNSPCTHSLSVFSFSISHRTFREEFQRKG